MFQYTHEVIINSLTRDGHDVFQASAGVLNILRSGSYKFEHVVDGKIYKTAGYEGKVSSLMFDFTDTSKFVEDGTYRLTIFTKMPNKFLGEYANANWYEFGKPLMVEFSCVGTMTAEMLMNKVASALRLALPENNQWLKITTGDASKVTVQTKDPYMIFSGVTLEYYEPTACDSCVGYYEMKDLASNVKIENGREPFATAAWITENLRFPSYRLGEPESGPFRSFGGGEGDIRDDPQDVLLVLAVQPPCLVIVPRQHDLRPPSHPERRPPFIERLEYRGPVLVYQAGVHLRQV